MSLGQWRWFGLALTVLILTSVVATPNLQEIYSSQKDFVVGSLFALVGFAFGKAFSRTQEQKALELIRDRPTGHVAEVLSGEINRTLHARGAFEDVVVLERNIEAAADRLLKYFDTRAQRLESYRDSADLTAALDDLDHAAADLRRLRDRLAGYSAGTPLRNGLAGPALASINRSISAANDRGRELYELLKVEAADSIGDDSWAVFGVLAYDIRKAERTLGRLRNGRDTEYNDEYLAEVGDYLRAALERAKVFKEMVGTGPTKMPELFTIMIGDMTAALNGIDRIAAAATARSSSRIPGA